MPGATLFPMLAAMTGLHLNDVAVQNKKLAGFAIGSPKD
jgi:hypothetical protein